MNVNVDKLQRQSVARRRTARDKALMLGLGMLLGWALALGCASSRRQADFRLISQAWATIQREYVDRSSINADEITYGAISGMVDALGDTGHSTFLTPDMVRELRNMEKGEFKGIGVEIQMKAGRVVIVAPIDGSPAQKAGLKPGDIITKVSGEDVTDWPLGRVVERIVGPPGTTVTLAVEDPITARARQLTLKRVALKLHEVTWNRLPGTDIAHLRIASFDAGVTKDLKQALAAIERQQMKGLVLDLRNDPGGLLDEAVGVASQFIEDGNVVLMKDAKGQVTPVPVEKRVDATDLPMVVLVNQGSASAAEIVAGALQDTGRAQLVGETTFGTGTVLGQFRLSDGSALLLAIEEWLTPKGRSFWHKGISPQYAVTLPPEISPLVPIAERGLTSEQLAASDDRQLLAAVRLLSTQEVNESDKASLSR